jgi:hypothetical protein
MILTFEKFKLFLEKDSKMYEYGCLMVYLNIPNWSEFLSKIDPQDLYETDNDRYGLESEPHCTILYGLHDVVSDDEVMELFSSIRKSDFDLKVDGIDCFFNKDYDVLKLNIKSSRLNQLNEISKTLPHTSQYPDYKPHVTLAYLKKGQGGKYIQPRANFEIKTIDKIVYSKPNGEKIDIPLM